MGILIAADASHAERYHSFTGPKELAYVHCSEVQECKKHNTYIDYVQSNVIISMLRGCQTVYTQWYVWLWWCRDIKTYTCHVCRQSARS